MKQIVIPKKLLSQIIQHAREGNPYEVCGLLGGCDDEVLEVYPIKNTEASTVSYFMDPKEQLRAMKAMREKSQKMVGIYHSHPVAGAYPSQKDVSLAFYDDVAYVIVSLMHEPPQVRAFEIKEGKVKEIPIVVTETE
ncbi:MAG: M67 family peptidase [Nitrospirae bacterium]|nr:MAG: M67 family peptidase [Nitrospirota bacterium]